MWPKHVRNSWHCFSWGVNSLIPGHVRLTGIRVIRQCNNLGHLELFVFPEEGYNIECEQQAWY